MTKTSKILAYCSECGYSQGVFSNESEMRFNIAEQKNCGQCGANFGFLSDGGIWNLRWEILRSANPVLVGSKPLSKKVFIVHGTNHNPMKELKTVLKEIGLNPVVLHEQASKGDTLIEKLEKHSDVSFAFVILTPDDGLFNIQQLVELMNEIESKRLSKTREDRVLLDEFLKIIRKVARQNVILEFGYFVGLLGRQRVCCLCSGDVTLPSDMLGLVYVPFERSVHEVKETIYKELREAGYDIK